ncbi:hypothetical protein BDV25DRAFT_135180 [Aspergillus avenaceus]|uniref:Uncharacterized protein n=1 Tax=Aspergillus avenaceus TaxID=36643 RepID=A0A5N6U936_ASPAV|nr:hypothetical protein BDV25DRAFT_135180 [Aspergillus avenaceus]
MFHKFYQQRTRGIWYVIPTIFLIATYSFYLFAQRSPVPLATTPDPKQEIPGLPEPESEDAVVSPPSETPLSSEKVISRTLVVAQTQDEDTLWVNNLAQDDPNLKSAVYVVDNSSAPLTVPVNKGHEVMVYLTYIIDHYHNLSDVTMFMHAHQITWHNNDFLDSDSAEMVRHLKGDHVLKNGYMNLRCHLEPGCPEHIHPYVGEESADIANVPEAAVIGNAWQELFPQNPVPSVLSQPCCGQFAASADRIRQVPLSKYADFRNWLLNTSLEDRISGRVWEYVWQWLFTGQSEFCPVETTCYCEGYGICFDPGEYDLYFKYRDEARKLEEERQELLSKEQPEPFTRDQIEALTRKIDDLHRNMNEIKTRAKETR